MNYFLRKNSRLKSQIHVATLYRKHPDFFQDTNTKFKTNKPKITIKVHLTLFSIPNCPAGGGGHLIHKNKYTFLHLNLYSTSIYQSKFNIDIVIPFPNTNIYLLILLTKDINLFHRYFPFLIFACLAN